MTGELMLSFPPRPTGPCQVCGSSASSRKIMLDPQRPLNPGRVIMVCRAHEAVCRVHLADPCPECDSR